MPTRNTRDQILDAAEGLFAEHGFNGVSVRRIAAAAGANLGSIPYYFGNKETLLKAVIERAAIPELEERSAGIRQVLDAAGDGVPDITALLRADLEPMFRRRRGDPAYRRLAARIWADPAAGVRQVVAEIYDTKSTALHLALKRACPHLPRKEFYWRFFCLFGAVQYVLADLGKIQRIAGPGFETSDPETALKYIVPYLAQGLMSPPVDAPDT